MIDEQARLAQEEFNRTEQFRDTELDLEAWQKLYYKYQQGYIRKRLSAIKYLLRLKLPHHLPLETTIADIEKEIEIYLQNHQLQTSQQTQNTIDHICNLATQS